MRKKKLASLIAIVTAIAGMQILSTSAIDANPEKSYMTATYADQEKQVKEQYEYDLSNGFQRDDEISAMFKDIMEVNKEQSAIIILDTAWNNDTDCADQEHGYFGFEYKVLYTGKDVLAIDDVSVDESKRIIGDELIQDIIGETVLQDVHFTPDITGKRGTLSIRFTTSDDKENISASRKIVNELSKSVNFDRAFLSNKVLILEDGVVWCRHNPKNIEEQKRMSDYSDEYIDQFNMSLKDAGLKGSFDKTIGRMVYPADCSAEDIIRTGSFICQAGFRPFDIEGRGICGTNSTCYTSNYYDERRERGFGIDFLAPKGDANASGSATISDVVSVLQFGANAEKYPLDIQAQFNCDMIEDNSVDAKDAYDIQVLISQQ